MYLARIDEDRTFGVEIEGFGIEPIALSMALHNRGIPAMRTGYTHETTSYWKITSDASISGPYPFEIVSPILSVRNNGLQDLETVLKTAQELGGRVNTSCGFHVHWNISDFGGKNLQSLLRLYAKFEPVIDYLVAPSRRGDENQFCHSMIKDHDLSWVSDLDRSGRSHAQIVVNRFGDTFGGFLSRRASRYHKVNVSAYTSYGTVEFRQHQGTLSPRKAINWILFTQQLINKSRDASVSKGMSAKMSLGELIRVLRLPPWGPELRERNPQLFPAVDDERLVDLRSWMKERYSHFRAGLDDE